MNIGDEVEVVKCGCGLGERVASKPIEMEKHIAETKIPSKVFIKEKIFEDLKSMFGKDIEILINY